MSDRADAAQTLAEQQQAAAQPADEGTVATATPPAPDDDGGDGAADEHGAEGNGRTADPATRAARREAASYRTRLRETEAERDTLRERVDRADRAEAERIAAAELAAPGDLWLLAEISGMRDDRGDLSAELVRDEIARVLTEHPHWAKGRPVEFAGGARPPHPANERPGFGAALKRALNGER
jgi:hypothetical protein